MGLCLKPVLNHPNDSYLMLKLMKVDKGIPYSGFHYSMLHHKGIVKDVLEHPNELYPLLKMNMEMKRVKKLVPKDPSHWHFCYSMLNKVSTTFVLVIQQLDSAELRDAACMYYLVLRALDTIEDDSSVTAEMKLQVLKDFHRHIYDRDFHFPCGTKDKKVLMDNFHYVSTAFLELDRSYQEVIEDITMRMGAGMAKYICKEVETIDDYDEYCYYVAGLGTLGFSKLFHASGTVDILSLDPLSISMGLFLQKADIIKDFMEDISELPKSQMFWPREIWSKYSNNLRDLKYEENSEKATHCVNEMVTNALVYVDDCFKYMSQLRDPDIFRFFAIMEVVSMGELALCYNNIQVFKSPMSVRRGLMAQVFIRTKTMTDVYGAFYDFSSILRSKVRMNDPNAKTTISRIEAVQKLCLESGTLTKWKSYVVEREPSYNRALIVLLITNVAVFYVCASFNQLNKIGSTLWETKLPTHTLSIGNVKSE